MSRKKTKATPSEAALYQKNTSKIKLLQDDCVCGWGHLNRLIEEQCEQTGNFGAVAIAMQLRPDVRVRSFEDDKVTVCWQEPGAKQKALIRAAQQAIADEYWESKVWSDQVEEILANPNGLSEFGIGLYEKMLNSERFKRYRHKKQLKHLEEIYG